MTIRSGVVALAVLLTVLSNGAPSSAQWSYLGLAGHQVRSLVAAGDRLYACTESGLFAQPRAGADTTWSACGLTGQTVLDVAVVSPDTLLAAIEADVYEASLFRSVDGGAHWEPFQRNLMEDDWTCQVRDLAVGAAPTHVLHAMAGGYMARSYDSGLGWDLFDPHLQMGGYPRFVAVVPGAPLRLWVRGSTIQFAPIASRSLDGGTTWNGSHLHEAASGSDESCLAIAADPQAPDVAYAGLASHGAWKTSDGGSSWTPILPTENPVCGLAVSPSDHVRVYALTHERYGVPPALVLHVSGDGGATWHGMTAPAVGYVSMQALCVDDAAPGDRILLSAGLSGVHAYADATTGAAEPTGSASPLGALRVRPNPGNPRTLVSFSLATAGRVRLGIYDLPGQQVRELLNGDLSAGPQAATWDGRDDAGRDASSGTYLVRLSGSGQSRQRRMTLLR